MSACCHACSCSCIVQVWAQACKFRMGDVCGKRKAVSPFDGCRDTAAARCAALAVCQCQAVWRRSTLLFHPSRRTWLWQCGGSLSECSAWRSATLSWVLAHVAALRRLVPCACRSGGWLRFVFHRQEHWCVRACACDESLAPAELDTRAAPIPCPGVHRRGKALVRVRMCARV